LPKGDAFKGERGALKNLKKTRASVEEIENISGTRVTYYFDGDDYESIKDSFEFFSDLVKASRGNKIKPENFKTIFDGRVFTGRQALKYGLIDDIGGIRSVENYLLKYKIDVKKTPIKEIEVEKKDKKLLNKFLGFFPFLNNLEGKDFKNKIMAITP
ncbi:MAG: S49 family peptidase, partial [Alphaproteobacteria bacterium]